MPKNRIVNRQAGSENNAPAKKFLWLNHAVKWRHARAARAKAQIVTRLQNTIAARLIESIYRAVRARLLAIIGGLRVNSFQFGLFCLLSFAVPVPILAWLDRRRNGKKS